MIVINALAATESLSDLLHILADPDKYRGKLSELLQKHNALEKRAEKLLEWEKRLKKKEAALAALIDDCRP